MKFRGKLTDSEMINLMIRVLTSMCKYSKSLVLRVTDEHWHILADARHVVNGQLIIWCQLIVDHYFTEYKFKGVSNENNAIVMEISSEKLNNMIVSINPSVKEIKIKLKNGSAGPVLSFQIDYPSNDKDLHIDYEVPIKVIERKDWDHYNQPQPSPFQVEVYLSDYKIMKGTVERLMSMYQFAVITAKSTSERGSLVIKVETDATVVASKFGHLEIPKKRRSLTTNVNETESKDISIREEPSEVRIDIRKLNTFLNSLLVKPSRVLCSLTHEDNVHFHFFHDFVSFKVFICHVTI